MHSLMKRRVLAVGAVFTSMILGFSSAMAGSCPQETDADLIPATQEAKDHCKTLWETVKDPSAYPLAEYQDNLNRFFINFCHRDKSSGWVRDKFVRDTGPGTATLINGEWVGKYFGTHAPVVIWYSPVMYEWIKKNRTAADEHEKKDKEVIPDGAMIIKEMYASPASKCADVKPERLLPTPHGAAIMIRDNDASHDGWFWGWYGFTGFANDYPANKNANNLPNMGFGQYCVNCHASARDNFTFSSSKNIEGETGRPLVFLSQDDDASPDMASNHPVAVLPGDLAPRLGQPLFDYNPEFTAAFPWPWKNEPRPTYGNVSKMPSETYDNVYVEAGGPSVHSEYLTSDQCLGCHDAGSTGLQFDMTVPVTPAEQAKLPYVDITSGQVDSNTKPTLWNHSPYGTWRTSPMGLAGRDPIFFAQLASETQTFNKPIAPVVENTCLGCHGFMGQRQYGIDQYMKAFEAGNVTDQSCGTFGREMANAVPYPAGNPSAEHANYGALARDGISCLSCHRMVLFKDASEKVANKPENHCVQERQAFLNPDLKGFGKTFTGSFLVGPPDEIYGPFEKPVKKPMEHALANTPKHNSTLAMSETCGTCHTVHLPVYLNGTRVKHNGKNASIYEQLTYPEWAFSAYRTGTSPDGDLPGGEGDHPKSCQYCHMPNLDPDGKKTKSRIASIQEYSNFPQAEFTLEPAELDLPVREGFARHTLVGLNLFLTKMGQQFPDVLGIRTTDPMLGKKGVDQLIFTEQQMLNQAAQATVKLEVHETDLKDDTLTADIWVTNLVGHKFPSGVGFRRAFLTFEVMNAMGQVIWASGRTDGAGRIIDAKGMPLDGELWWEPSCKKRIEPEKRLHQPHYQTITSQSQAQIYQELVSTPTSVTEQCGHDATPTGHLTTSFLSICAEVKDNRLLPLGFLPLKERIKISAALGADAAMAEDSGATAVDGDSDYGKHADKGRDTLKYVVKLSDMKGGGKHLDKPASVRVRMSYQATPPFYLQDRFCTAKGADTSRLYFLAGNLNLNNTAAEDWKFAIADTGAVAIKK
jgi:hypothetical protein